MQKKKIQQIINYNSGRNNSGKITVRHRASGVNREVSIVNSFIKCSGVKGLLINDKKDFLKNMNYNFCICQKKNYITVTSTELVIISVTNNGLENISIILFVSFFGSRTNTNKENGSSSGSGDSSSDDDDKNNNKNIVESDDEEKNWLSYIGEFYENHKTAIWVTGGILITLTLIGGLYYFRDEIYTFLFGNKYSPSREELIDIQRHEPRMENNTLSNIVPNSTSTSSISSYTPLPKTFNTLLDQVEMYYIKFNPYSIDQAKVHNNLRSKKLFSLFQNVLNKLPEPELLQNSYKNGIEIINGITKPKEFINEINYIVSPQKLTAIRQCIQTNIATQNFINFELRNAIQYMLLNNIDENLATSELHKLIENIYIASLHISKRTDLGSILIKDLKLNDDIIYNLTDKFLYQSSELMHLMHAVAKDKNEVTRLGLTLAQVFDVQFSNLIRPTIFGILRENITTS